MFCSLTGCLFVKPHVRLDCFLSPSFFYGQNNLSGSKPVRFQTQFLFWMTSVLLDLMPYIGWPLTPVAAAAALPLDGSVGLTLWRTEGTEPSPEPVPLPRTQNKTTKNRILITRFCLTFDPLMGKLQKMKKKRQENRQLNPRRFGSNWNGIDGDETKPEGFKMKVSDIQLNYRNS